MKNSIVFRIDVDREESYGTLANFISKRERHLTFSNEEVSRVTYKYYLNNNVKTLRDWAKNISRDGEQFTSVKQPQDIKNITEKYEVLYCLNVEVESDIADMQNLFLIYHYYSKLNILVLFENCKDNEYHTISQFLYRINSVRPEFRDACYFVKDGKAQHAQMNNIPYSRAFIPLQIVEKDSLNRLFQSTKDLVDEEYLRKILKNDKIESADTDRDLIEGAIKLLHDARKGVQLIPEKRLIQMIQRMDVFSFILVCYVACMEGETFDISLLEEYMFEMQQYAGAIMQLAENIVFHSQTGVGVVTFRVHKKGSKYIREKYHLPEDKIQNSYLEVMVSDFCGDDQVDNIAENFVSKLEDPIIRNKFSGLCPKDFFSHTDENKETWREFYSDPDNIGKHFGLRIFQSVVSAFHGFFGAESHNGYRNQTGDSFLSYEGDENRDCMPGTRYHIVFPIEPVQKVIREQDMSLDSGIYISRNIKSILSLSTGKMDIEWSSAAVQSQQNKNQQIRNISKRMWEELLDKGKCDIIYLSMEAVEESRGEMIAKAMVIALYHAQRDVTVVLYQCTDHMKKNIFNTLKIFFADVDIEGMFLNRKSRIVLFSEKYEETVIDLSSAYNTDNINAYIAHMKCITSTEWSLCGEHQRLNLEKGAKSYIPCDVLRAVEISGKEQTLFEHYTEQILERDIQKNEFGCKFEHTHMRLGSTIHIDSFYEAEILFNNKLFVSRFALLLVKEMLKDIENIDKLTLYGYGTYSETVLVQMVEMIQNYYPQKRDVDYIILEREEERRGFLHKDRLRYNQLFQSKEDRVKYFKDRKIATVVLINSTLKTHVRLISLFKDETGKEEQDNSWLIRNYAVLLVGAADKNQYWRLEDGKQVQILNGKIEPIPRYFIQLPVSYQEPIACEYCFPENPMAETPLIEVNAASTIPNQAFGITEDPADEMPNLEYEWIRKEEEQISTLKGKFIYGHVQRNENHFLYYFKTEEIGVKTEGEINEREKIINSLRDWKKSNYRGGTQQYNIIVAPMHYSNAGFVELVNNVIFDGNAILLRVDFDKEYRCNAYAKFSYLRSYVSQLCARGAGGVICVHFVDDVIISGRSFHRAKSLIESVLNFDDEQRNSVEIRIFDKVFVLVDRNSSASRMQYVKCQEKDYYAFRHVNISSLRNYGDSCVLCNLKKESDLLWDTASTELVANYWADCSRKFQLYTLEEYEEKQDQKSERGFQRLFCTHMAQCILKEEYHGNDQVQTMYLILKLLNKDYESRKEDRYEYFLSYLKCISRPFLVFQKSVKEAIFDILLLVIDATIRKEPLRKIIKEAELKKPYLAERRLILQFNKLDKNILNDSRLKDKDKRDLVKLLMKQLTELKSNYIIRPEKMDAIFLYMKGVDESRFEIYYMTLIDRLVGASSDTTKSIWLDEQMERATLQNVTREYQAWIILENTRAFRDGIEKFYIKRTVSAEFRKLSDDRITAVKESYDYNSAAMMFEDFRAKNQAELKKYSDMTDLDSEAAYNMEKRIKQFIKNLPSLKMLDFQSTANSLERRDENWSHILEEEYNMLQVELEWRRKEEQKSDSKERLTEIINNEPDVYQYSNFYKILQRDGYMLDGHQVSADGIDMIVSCTKVLDLCRNADMKIVDKVRELAVLFKIILHAQKVQFIVENKEDNNLDEWKKEIEKQYNAIAQKWNENSDDKLPPINIAVERHYTVIMERSDTEDCNMEPEDITEKLLDRMNQSKGLQHNYITDMETGTAVWRLENKSRCIWINIKNSMWCNEDGNELIVARDMRRIMMFYQELKREIFNPENDDFINEIVHIQKELNIYNSNKVYTHAKEYPQKVKYEQTLRYFSGKSGDDDLFSYPSYVLNLLADINVSKYYRNGLQRKIRDDAEIRKPAVWKDFAVLLSDGKEFVYRYGEGESVSVNLNVSQIDEKDEILCKANNQDATREFTLLLYALILNAAERGRGKRQSKNGAVQEDAKSVIVNLYKEKDVLVIENECEEPVDIERIRRALHRVPEPEKDGVSLWSFNRYIKRCIYSLVKAKLNETEIGIAENRVSKEKILNLGIWIGRLTGEECMIQIEPYQRDNRMFFKLKLPVFMEKYHWCMGEEDGEGGIV